MRERGPRYTPAIAEPIVVDASIAYLWFANEPDRSGADALLETDSPLLAPDLNPSRDCRQATQAGRGTNRRAYQGLTPPAPLASK